MVDHCLSDCCGWLRFDSDRYLCMCAFSYPLARLFRTGYPPNRENPLILETYMNYLATLHPYPSKFENSQTSSCNLVSRGCTACSTALHQVTIARALILCSQESFVAEFLRFCLFSISMRFHNFRSNIFFTTIDLFS